MDNVMNDYAGLREAPDLYGKTGNIADCNTMLVNRGELGALLTERDSLMADAERLLKAAIAIEPHLDAIICYASTQGEHEPNRLAFELRASIDAARAERDALRARLEVTPQGPDGIDARDETIRVLEGERDALMVDAENTYRQGVYDALELNGVYLMENVQEEVDALFAARGMGEAQR